MTDNSSNQETLRQSMSSLVKKFILIVFVSIAFGLLIQKLWIKNLDIYHTLVETACIFIALTIFLSVWYTFQHQKTTHFHLGFGYLAVAVFDAFHAYYHLKLNLDQEAYFDVSTKFWILGRLCEALTLYISIKKSALKKNKWVSLIITLSACAAVYYVVIRYHDYMPLLLTHEGVTPLKIFLEYLVIFIYGLVLLKLKDFVIQKTDNLTYHYIFIAILTSASAELLFTLYASTSSVIWTIGHILKIVSYFYLLHGIFISTIIYPYKKLEQDHQLLEVKNETLVRDQEKLVQQEKLALLGQMGAGIVHETRNYLTTIKGCSQLIEHISQEEKVKKYASAIDKNINEVNEILSEFLFLSKPREIQLAEVSLNHIFDAIKSMVSTQSLMRGIPVEFHISKKERSLFCDESQLKQVILNLCKNAAEAMSGFQGAKLVIETGLAESMNEMFIKIIDNGKGIPEEVLKKLGTPFFTTKRSGTGLGLSICYKIIENHKGRITIESEINKGTAFTIFLPCFEPKEGKECPVANIDAV